MKLERLEEILLVVIAAGLLSYVLPFSLPRNIITTVIIAFVLIALLILRSIAWHKDGITPFDGILVIGVGITIAYLASFVAFSGNPLNTIVLLLFACFYCLLAVMLYQHRFVPAAHPRVRHLRTWKIAPKRSREFKQGMEPLAERPPRWYKRAFANREPLPDHPPRWYDRTMIQGVPARQRGAWFRRAFQEPLRESVPAWERKTRAAERGMQPIPEITPAHLHKLGIYDSEPRRKR
jgi:hypothetical protein